MCFRKKLLILIVFGFIALNLYGQENGFTFRPFFGGGGGTGVFSSDGHALGGKGEFAFLFFSNNGFQICNHFVGRGNSITTASGNQYGTGSLTKKITFGGFLPQNFLRSYSFVEGGIGFGGWNETTALNVIFGGGGGIDLFFHNNGSIFLEIGYLQHHVNNELIGGVSISIGTRGFIWR